MDLFLLTLLQAVPATTVNGLWNSVHDGVQLGVAAVGIAGAALMGTKAITAAKSLIAPTSRENNGLAIETHRAVGEMHRDLGEKLVEQTTILRSIDGGIRALGDQRRLPPRG